MPKLIIDEKTFDPIEIEYKKKTYIVKPVTTELLLESAEVESRMALGEVKAIDEDVLLYLDIPKMVLKGMSYMEKNGILTFIGDAVQSPEQYQKLIKKKPKNPGVSSVEQL